MTELVPAASGEFAAAVTGEQAFLHKVLDELVAEHTTDEAAVVTARRLFEERRGRVFEDEELWEVWSAGFVEWLVVEHVAEEGGLARGIGRGGAGRRVGAGLGHRGPLPPPLARIASRKRPNR